MLVRHRRSPKNRTINKIYPDWLDHKGILTSLTNAPWAGEVSTDGLDIAYHGARSGGKFAAPVLYNFIDDDGEITQAGYTAVATMLLAKYGAKWEHLWGLYSAEYNPLDSYAMTETEERDSSRTLSSRDQGQHSNLVEYDIDETESVTRDETRIPNITEQLTLDTERSEENSVTRTPDISTEKSTTFSETKTPNTTESVTTTQSTDEDISSTKTPATTESKTKSTSNTRTPNLTERTELDEDISVTGTDDTETTYGKVTTTESQLTDENLVSKWGFNSADAVPATSNSETRDSTDTETQSGSDVIDRDTTESTDRDSVSVTTTTGTEANSGSETEQIIRSGTETVAETRDIDVTGSEERRKTGTETTASTESTETAESGTETTEETKSLSNSGTETTQTTGSERSAGTETTNRDGDNSVTTTESNDTTHTGSDVFHDEVERTKTGNLFKSPAELLSIDRDFWLMDFFEIVFMDIDAMLTLSIFPESEIIYDIY